MLFMIIEQLNNKTSAVHERFVAKGRMLPEGVVYHSSWIDPQTARCFQVMEAENIGMLQPWISAWSDLIDFEIVPVVTSQEYWAAWGT